MIMASRLSVSAFAYPTPYLLRPWSLTPLPTLPKPALSSTLSGRRRFRGLSTMEPSGIFYSKGMLQALSENVEDEYTSTSKLLNEFFNLSTLNKAWVFHAGNGKDSRAMFSVGQPNLLSNKKKTSILYSHIMKENGKGAHFEWSPFPVEMIGVSAIVPSPSGAKLLVVRNKEDGSLTQLEIWGSSLLLKEIHVPQSVHGPIYTDGWFEGISWNHDETLVAYIADEPTPPKPIFDNVGYKCSNTDDKACGTWKGQGEWEEHWGESYSSKKRPALFVANINSEEVHPVHGIKESLSVGQVVWAPPSVSTSDQYLVFVGWREDIGPQKTARKLGIKYCYNRPCSLYAVHYPFCEPNGVDSQAKKETKSAMNAINLTEDISSAFYPRFSPDGKFLVFFSARSSVESGAHCSTNSLHRIEWPAGQLGPSVGVTDVVPVVMFAEDDLFPGLYCSSLLEKPWLSDGCTLIVSSFWRSLEVILCINVLSGVVSRISPTNSNASWNVVAIDGHDILTVSSSPIIPPQLMYGQVKPDGTWHWIVVSSPFSSNSTRVSSLLSSLQFEILKIPVKEISENATRGASKPFEAIFVSNKNNAKDGIRNPLIIVLHGGPHSLSVSSYSKSLAFLASLGFSLLIVNYRGSLGFGEEALQSLPGKIGFQDVGDVLSALDVIIQKDLADPSKVAVLGGSHGGFLTTHLIGQAPQIFAAAAARNPVCNISIMVGTSDIPDWCFIEVFGSEGRNYFTEAPSLEQMSELYKKSPVAYLSKVKTPILFLLGNEDLRVPVSNGMQYARALKEKGCKVKVLLFPKDNHPLDRPQTDYESFLNIAVWFNKHCK